MKTWYLYCCDPCALCFSFVNHQRLRTVPKEHLCIVAIEKDPQPHHQQCLTDNSNIRPRSTIISSMNTQRYQVSPSMPNPKHPSPQPGPPSAYHTSDIRRNAGRVLRRNQPRGIQAGDPRRLLGRNDACRGNLRTPPLERLCQAEYLAGNAGDLVSGFDAAGGGEAVVSDFMLRGWEVRRGALLYRGEW